ncbi:hypothetical protein AAGO59_26785, partial [Klebsiella pneumoniae]
PNQTPRFFSCPGGGFLVSHIMISVKHTEAGERRRLCWFLLHLEGIAHGVSGCFFDHFHKNANLQT